MFEGEYRQWIDIDEFLILSPSKSNDFLEHQSYSQNGIVHKGLTDWKTITPFFKVPSEGSGRFRNDWGGRYILEFCFWLDVEPRIMGDHIWLRLKNPIGEIFSIGQYRSNKVDFWDAIIFPVKQYIAEIQSPDICEFWAGTKIETLSVEISESQFRDVILHAVAKQNQGPIIYHSLGYNCMDYVSSLSAICDIDLTSHLHIYKLLVPKVITKYCNSFYNSRTLLRYRSILCKLQTVFFNLIILLLGGAYQSKDVQYF